ncbi:hypothetical protein LTR16_001221 [Cryomyces antarcticus]|uniref:Large ribosomal subunit protein mL46 n=1 Tax=Cryomyces antarcticus TaxID=329879 RepID=A0ABR0LQD7_9PEZI|nr:hypothetical protein LTR16_001221 [Cryomyces antarcticus]
MNAGQRSARQLASRTGESYRKTPPDTANAIKGGPAKELICKSCREHLSRRKYSAAAAAVAETPEPISSIPPFTQASGPKQAYQLRAGVVLSRPPQLTRDLTPFEKAFFLYQRRLNERLALPFTRYFYFKKDTPADLEWKRKMKTRMTPARDIGMYNAYGKEGWNDEVLVGAKESETEEQIEALLKDVEVVSVGGAEGEAAKKESAIDRPMPRTTEADKSGDQKSLDRLLQRTLYLLVKNKEGRWTFPHGRIAGRENLHQTAERIIVQAGGVNMNTWVVGNAPIGHYNYDFQKTIVDLEKGVEELGERVFFMKARIMAGQANLKANKFGDVDFKWLAKEEVEESVTPKYWSAVRNMLAER